MERSAIERHSTSLNTWFEVCTTALPLAAVLISRSARCRLRRNDDRLERLRVTAQRDEQRHAVARRQRHVIGGRRFGQLGRLGVEADPGRAHDAVEPGIAQQHFVGAHHLAPRRAAPRAAHAAHLEDIGKIAVEGERQHEIDGARPVVAQRQALERGVAPEEHGAVDMQRVLLQHEALVEIDVRIGEVDVQDRVVVAQVRAEQQQLHAVDQDLEPRHEPRVVAEQPVAAAGRGADVAMRVDQQEGVVVLERSPGPGRRPGRGYVERRLGNRFDLRRACAGDRRAVTRHAFSSRYRRCGPMEAVRHAALRGDSNDSCAMHDRPSRSPWPSGRR